MVVSCGLGSRVLAFLWRGGSGRIGRAPEQIRLIASETFHDLGHEPPIAGHTAADLRDEHLEALTPQ